MNFRKGSHSGNRELIPVILPEVTMCYEFEEFYRARRAEQARRELEKAKELKEKPAAPAKPAPEPKTETQDPVPA